MADYREFYRKGTIVKYFPDDKVLMLDPRKSNKDDFIRLKSQIDTLLQIDGTKRIGNVFTLKLNNSFNVNIDEVLKSLGMKGGIEKEDAQSMVDDSAEEDVKAQEKEQAPEVDPASMGDMNQQQMEQPGMPQLEGVIRRGVFHFLFEADFFQPGVKKQKRKSAKRYGKYWKPIEQFTGKNRNALKPDDILYTRRKFSLKPASNERDAMLRSLDKAADYFYGKLEKTKGQEMADEFHENYISIDSLKPEDYIGDSENIDSISVDANIGNDGMSLMPNFDDIDYSDIDIEED